MMDRQKKDELPKMQVGFIDFVCMPLYNPLAELVPDFGPLLEGVKSNRVSWQMLADDPKAIPESDSSLDFKLPSLSTDEILRLSPGPPDLSPSNEIAPASSTNLIRSGSNHNHTPNINNGPIEGWRNSTGSDDTPVSPSHAKKVKAKSQPGTHAEVSSTRKHLKCAMS